MGRPAATFTYQDKQWTKRALLILRKGRLSHNALSHRLTYTERWSVKEAVETPLLDDNGKEMLFCLHCFRVQVKKETPLCSYCRPKPKKTPQEPVQPKAEIIPAIHKITDEDEKQRLIEIYKQPISDKATLAHHMPQFVQRQQDQTESRVFDGWKV